jgi:hypothetical protein
MGYMDKQPSRMQGQGNFIFGSWAEHATIFDWDLKILDLFCGGCPGVPDCGPWSVSTSPW